MDYFLILKAMLFGSVYFQKFLIILEIRSIVKINKIGLAESILGKWLYYQKQSTFAMQSPSELQ
jgi:hypothetical protein